MIKNLEYSNKHHKKLHYPKKTMITGNCAYLTNYSRQLQVVYEDQELNKTHAENRWDCCSEHSLGKIKSASFALLVATAHL